MEPGLRDRENSTLLRCGAWTSGSRNGARPERPGKHCDGRGCKVRRSCRNGARPERPGKHTGEAKAEHDTKAAMEPGLRDRENGDLAGNREAGRGAAMEPGLRDRENLYQDTGHMDTVKAAMEPGLRDRETPHVITYPAPPFSPQWSPA